MDGHKLKSLPLFSSLEKRDLEQIAHAADEVDVEEGKELLHEGSFAYEFMVIEDGTAEVVRDGGHVADLGPGDFPAKSRPWNTAGATRPSTRARLCRWSS
jgi:signal-transduction protein with cAMP-binding, CBS, and nucleotidyltransferase domain